MELRHLRYFLAVAEELNFTRAARRLNIAQPPLTQQIKALEAELGVMLFDRSTYRIELTAAGKLFAAEVARILNDVQDAVLLTQRAARGVVGQMRVGFTESASFNPVVPATFRTFRALCPGVEIALEEHQSIELIEALREGRVDAAFVRPPVNTGQGLTMDLLVAEEMVVALPGTHELANRPALDLRDLSNETFILYPRSVRPGLADAVIAACEQVGFTPRVEQFAPQLSSTVNWVAAGLGVSIVPKSMQHLQAHAVSYLPLLGHPLQAFLGIAHRTDETSAVVLKFVEAAKSKGTNLSRP